MEPFIKKQDYNYIVNCLDELNSTLRHCADPDIIEINRLHIQDKILGLFAELSSAQKDLLDITKISDPLFIDQYLKKLNPYVYGMEPVTNAEISKLFKKEKKLKLPSQDVLNAKKVFLGWADESVNKMYIAYKMNKKLLGMTCRIIDADSNKPCALCGNSSCNHENITVSSLCKTSRGGVDNYKSISFSICSDSSKCNDKITSTDKLEEILKEVHNLNHQ